MKEERCRYCMEEIHQGINFYDFIKQDAMLCGNCKAQLIFINKVYDWNGMRFRIYYQYNTFLEGMLFQYKEGRDVALQDVFFYDLKKEILAKYRHHIFILMPSSEAKTRERGFRPLIQMLEQLHIQWIDPFYKKKEYKQSLQSFEQRKQIHQVMDLKEGQKFKKAKYVLVDDVCTSGATLSCAYDLLKEHKLSIEAMTLCATKQFVESCDEKALHKRTKHSILWNVFMSKGRCLK